jgi:hypothetical protein
LTKILMDHIQRIPHNLGLSPRHRLNLIRGTQHGILRLSRRSSYSGRKTSRRSIYLFILWISLMTKTEIERKCCHGYSNHGLKVNVAILIQIIKHIDGLFLRDVHNMNQ